MTWNDVELIDGKFYFVDVERWEANVPNEWIFEYKSDGIHETSHGVCACIERGGRMPHVYMKGHICSSQRILSLRPCTSEDMGLFLDYLDNWGYRYNFQTKELTHGEGT